MRAPVNAGDLRHRVTIESPARTSDEAGGATIEWQSVGDVWAAIWPRAAYENLRNDRIAGTATHDIWIRYRKDVTPEMRIRCGNRVFAILGAIDIEDRSRWLKCPSEERDL